MARYTPAGLRGSEQNAGDKAAERGGLGIRGWLRWIWRQLTSMRVALLLLLLLTVVALPGAFIPQRRVNPNLVNQFFTDNPTLAPWLDRIYMFDVFSSPWFSAVYLLLFTSLIGCIIPRSLSHAKALRSQPSRVPARFSRFEVRSERVVDAPAKQVASQLHATMKRYRTKRASEKGEGGKTLTISAERGYGKETGNLIFHMALVGLLIVTAWGDLVHYRGQAMITEGRTFVNSALDYDSFESGALFDADSVDPYRIRLDEFVPEFSADAQPRDFTANVTVFETDGTTSQDTIRVNHPLSVSGSRVYLMGNGFAPDLTLTDAAGEVAHDGPVVFIPADNDPNYGSTGVLMAPDANNGEEQLAFNGTLLPTAVEDEEGGFVGSGFPLPLDPVLVLQMYTGDLGLDEGVPRNLFTLDITGLEQVTTTDDDGSERPVQLVLRPGQSVDLPGDRGTLTFNDLPRFVALDLRYDPAPIWQGIFATAAFLGLIAALFLPRRRVWVRCIPQSQGSTVVHIAGLTRNEDPGLRGELDRILGGLKPGNPEEK